MGAKTFKYENPRSKTSIPHSRKNVKKMGYNFLINPISGITYLKQHFGHKKIYFCVDIK